MENIEKIKELASKIGDVPSEYLEGLNDAIMILTGYSVEEVVEFRNERKSW